MDSREPPQPPPPPRLQPQPSSAPPSMMVAAPVSFSPTPPNPIPSSMISPNSSSMLMAPATARFPFSSLVQPSRSPPPQPSESLSISTPYEGSSSALRPCGFSIDSPKRKRGRPRKYSPDGGIALGLAPTPVSSSGPVDLSTTPSGEPPAKKSRGRPPGSGKKQMDALGVGGTGFTPHVILVKTGEDIAAKIMSFCEQGPRSVCILSANGAVCNATLRQPAMSGGTMHYEGRYEIISISGSFQPSDDSGGRPGSFSITLAAADGKVVGGSVTGMMIAASPVQVVLGSFVAEGKKSSSSKEKSGPSTAAPGTQMLNFGASSLTPTSATSQGASSDSSDDDGDSPVQRGTGTGPGVQINVSQPIQWSHRQLWPGQNPQR